MSEEKDGHLQIKLKSDTKDVLYIQVQEKKITDSRKTLEETIFLFIQSDTTTDLQHS
jgi:hypothetical protein